MQSQLISSSYQATPWRTHLGSAWWLLCQPSPNVNGATHQFLKVAIDAWTTPASVADGHVFRPVNRGDQAQGVGLSEKVVWQLLQEYATAAVVPGVMLRYRDDRAIPWYEAGSSARSESS
jgi:hypothetical protein